MAHLTIYVKDDVERWVHKAARAARISISKWAAERVWPPEFLGLAGAFPDFPDTSDRLNGYGEDIPRENLD